MEYHLRVYADRSELVEPDGTSVTFIEGVADSASVKRQRAIRAELEDGYLTKQIELCRDHPEAVDFSRLTDTQRHEISSLVNSMTSEVGRAIIGLTVLQLTVKSICPDQNIRLHKSGNRTSFGWRDGIPMRPLDASYVTPALRQYDLLKLNAFGFMMTRTLAENYPYSKVYKAAIRGGREYWLRIVDGIEDGTLPSKDGLLFLLSQLLNNAAHFQNLADNTLVRIRDAIQSGRFDRPKRAIALFSAHMQNSRYAARIMEISMHALLQSVEEAGGLGDASLVPLSQMRSANKKHGNIGDIELREGKRLVQAWDAKYGKSYLRDEIEELLDKIELHPSIRAVGFVTSLKPDLSEEIVARVADVEEALGIQLTIEDYNSWVTSRLLEAERQGADATAILRGWVQAYAESLTQRRNEIAPIDEPCMQWVRSLNDLL